MPALASLQEILDCSFREPALLEQALVHSSYLNENPGFKLGHNERLEFLGDAVLGLVVAEKLYQDFPNLSEGQMTKLRAALVCRDALVRVAQYIGLGAYLFLGKGEEATGGRDKPLNLAGALEAVIAAVFLDQGLSATRQLILRLWEKEISAIKIEDFQADAKSRLQEFLQARQQGTPDYCLLDATGPDHDRVFTIEVRVGDKALGVGSGKSKKEAEQDAARKALENIS